MTLMSLKISSGHRSIKIGVLAASSGVVCIVTAFIVKAPYGALQIPLFMLGLGLFLLGIFLSKAKVRCPFCGLLVPPNAPNCPNCGRAWEGKCPYCGVVVNRRAPNCIACGRSWEKVPAETSREDWP